MKRQLVAAGLFLFIAAIAVGGIWFIVKLFTKPDTSVDFHGKTKEEIEEILNTDTFYSGIYINQTSISGRTKEDVFTYFQSITPELSGIELKYTFRVEQTDYPIPEGATQIDSDLQKIIDEAYEIGRTVNIDDLKNEKDEEYKNEIILTRRYEAYLDLQENPKKYNIKYDLNMAAVEAAVKELLTPLDQPALNASVADFNPVTGGFLYETEQTGIVLNIENTLVQVRTLLEQKIYEKIIEVPVDIAEPDVTVDALSGTLNFIDSASTNTEPDSARNNNISLVCQIINGLVIMPGDSFDFNPVVGERTPERGFLKAGAISDGLATKEYGGGICQVSSMLYIAALKADLTITARTHHLWPSSYLPQIGTDATVSWGGPEFRFVNSTNYPIAISAYFDGNSVTVAIYGRPLEDGLKITVIGEKTLDQPPKPTKYIADPTLPVGQQEEVSKARNEIGATSYKVYTRNGVVEKRVEVANSYYAPIQGVIKIGVLGEDGTIYKMDEETGKVDLPETTPSEPDTSTIENVPVVPTDTAPVQTLPPEQDGPDIDVED